VRDLRYHVKAPCRPAVSLRGSILGLSRYLNTRAGPTRRIKHANSKALPQQLPSRVPIPYTTTPQVRGLHILDLSSCRINFCSDYLDITACQTTTLSEHAVSHPRPINQKGQNHHNSQASAHNQQEKHLHPSLQHNVTPQTHLPRSPPVSGLPVYGPQNKPQPSYPTVQESRRARRGSDSSCDSGGFRDVRGGGEKWFIGGKTATGEEKYYKLSMVRRDRSADRISTDQLSL
jgi:hypothetical protein